MNRQDDPKSLSLPKRSQLRLKAIATDLETSLPGIEQLSPVALAYLGDAVYELYLRTYYLLPPQRISAYHQQVVAQARAERQADHLQALEVDLTETERDILRRGRNAATRCPQRLSAAVYRQATSLETLIGYLYLTNPDRLNQLLAKLELDTLET
ncbi:MAG: Mini-ribonuclease 3 [Spirulinaceae cyanobacterium]